MSRKPTFAVDTPAACSVPPRLANGKRSGRVRQFRAHPVRTLLLRGGRVVVQNVYRKLTDKNQVRKNREWQKVSRAFEACHKLRGGGEP